VELDALEQLHSAAREDGADIVVGKVVGHGKNVPRGVFSRNRHAEPFDAVALLGLLTPHKLFRRGFLEQHGLRFPEGRRRLEDHAFVVDAYLNEPRITVLAQRPVYHWMRRDDANASFGGFDPEPYYGNVREVLDLVERRTEPGPWREQLHAHWYRGKMLGRVGGRTFLRREDGYRRELYEAVRRLAMERFDERVHEHLGLALRARSHLLRAGDYEALMRLAAFEDQLKAHVALKGVTSAGTHLVLRLECRLDGQEAPLVLERDGDALRWRPPEDLRAALEGCDLEAPAPSAAAILHDVEHATQYTQLSRTALELREDGVPVLRTTVPIAPTAAAAGGPLPDGSWELRIHPSVGGFSAMRKVRRDKRPLLLTTYAPGRIVDAPEPPEPPSLARRVYRRLPGAVVNAARRPGAAAPAGR
jgi:hypothetical protein